MGIVRAFSIVSCMAFAAGSAVASAANQETGRSAGVDLQSMIARFVPTEITADVSGLSAGDRRALDKLIAAARRIDEIFLRQVWSGNAALRDTLRADTSPEGRQRLHYFEINFGPWSRLDGGRAFVPGVPEKQPPGASFYPEDLTKDEFEAWVKGLPDAEQQKARGFFWVVRRDAGGRLQLVPYGREYRGLLEPVARLLREAAALTDNATLRSYLTKRAEAFASDDYYDSDVAWMELDAPLDVTIGPYETYNDELFGYKAAFEAFVTLRDDRETAKLAEFGSHLQELENNLPIDPKHRNPRLGAAAPIRVVNEVFVAGDTKAGVQTAAFNLPNDERVVHERGSKRVMLKNMQEAKFEKILRPIAAAVLDASQQADLSFDAFFTHVLAHELMHGLGPHQITVGGKATTVRQEMQELYSAVEEGKADVTGLWALQYLIDAGVVPRSMERPLYVTYLAGLFRSVRFGLDEAHARGVAVQFNDLVDRGAIVQNPDGRFHIDVAKAKEGVRALTHDFLTLEAEGDKQGAAALLSKYAVIRPGMRKTLDGLGNLPVDIESIFPLAR